MLEMVVLLFHFSFITYDQCLFASTEKATAYDK